MDVVMEERIDFPDDVEVLKAMLAERLADETGVNGKVEIETAKGSVAKVLPKSPVGRMG